MPALILSQPSNFIHVDQFGYLPTAEKVLVIADPQIGYNSQASFSPSSVVQVIDESNDQPVLSVSPQLWSNGDTHSQSGDRGWWVDISQLSQPGSYHLLDPTSGERSPSFEVSEDPYQQVLGAAFKVFYYNRCNFAKKTPYAGPGWTDDVDFLHPLQDANCRYVFDPNNAQLEKDLSGGWWDAGDFNKYVTFAYTAVHQLLWAYQDNPDIWTDAFDIPESGNGVPDVLDELKWELLWLLKMTNPDGSTHIKMGSTSHDINVAVPPSSNTDPRYYGPTCTSASVAAAGMLAHAAWVFNAVPGQEDFTLQMQERAVLCWEYFKNRFDANTLETNCDDQTIVSGDADWDVENQRDAGIATALYLFLLTGDNQYEDFIVANYSATEPIASNWWSPYRTDLAEALLYYSTMSGSDAAASAAIWNSATNVVESNNTEFFAFTDSDLYRGQVPDWMYHWGSNLPKANVGNLCMIMKKFGVSPSRADTLQRKASELLHTYHGVNPLGIVYLTNMYQQNGDRCANEMFHTWFGDGTDWDNALTSPYGPPPGYVVGGPNSSYSGSLSPPAGQPLQKAYLDFNSQWPDNSWEITEPAIYYQAAYVRLLSNFVQNGTTVATTNILAVDDCIEIFPNPTNNLFTVRGELDLYKVDIFDTMGNFFEAAVSGYEAQIDLSSLPVGTILLRIENVQNQQLCVQKIIKN